VTRSKARTPDVSKRLDAARDRNRELEQRLADARKLINVLYPDPRVRGDQANRLVEVGAWLRELAHLAYPMTARTYDNNGSRSAETPLPGESTAYYRKEQDRLISNIVDMVRASRDRCLEVSTKDARRADRIASVVKGSDPA